MASTSQRWQSHVRLYTLNVISLVIVTRILHNTITMLYLSESAQLFLNGCKHAYEIVIIALPVLRAYNE